jgi:hypothetical protein
MRFGEKGDTMTRYLVLALAVVLSAAVAEAAFRAGRITVTTTATALYTAPARGGSVLLCNRHTASVYIGGDGTLTTANGFEIAAGDCTTQRPFPNESIWFIVGAATARVDFAEGQYREP